MVDYQKLGAVLGALVVVGAISFAMTVYTAMAFIDQNLAYMALYYDDMAVDLYQSGASYDAVVMIEAQALRFCELYLAEKRTLTSWEYEPICDVIYERSTLFVMCLEDVDLCSDELITELEDKIKGAEALGKQLKESRPYMSYVFTDKPITCLMGNQEVPCPSTQ